MPQGAIQLPHSSVMDVADYITHARLTASVSQKMDRADHIRGSSIRAPGTRPNRYATVGKSKSRMENHAEFFNMGRTQSSRQTEPDVLTTAAGNQSPHPKQEADKRSKNNTVLTPPKCWS